MITVHTPTRRNPIFRWLLALALLTGTATNLDAAVQPFAPNPISSPSTSFVSASHPSPPIASLFGGEKKRTRAIQITAVGMALALFIIVWRRT